MRKLLQVLLRTGKPWQRCAPCVTVALLMFAMLALVGAHAQEEPPEATPPVVYSSPITFQNITFVEGGTEEFFPIIMAGADAGITSDKPRFVAVGQTGACTADFEGDAVEWSGQNVTIDPASGAWTADREGRASVTATVISDASRQDTWAFEAVELKITDMTLYVGAESRDYLYLVGREGRATANVSHTFSALRSGQLAGISVFDDFIATKLGARFSASPNIRIDEQTGEWRAVAAGAATIRATSVSDPSIFAEASFTVHEVVAISIADQYGAKPAQVTKTEERVPYSVIGHLSSGAAVLLNQYIDGTPATSLIQLSSMPAVFKGVFFEPSVSGMSVTVTATLQVDSPLSDTWTFDIVDAAQDDPIGLSGMRYALDGAAVQAGESGILTCTPADSVQGVVWTASGNITLSETVGRTCKWTANAAGAAFITAMLADDPAQSIIWTFEVGGPCCTCAGCAVCNENPKLHNSVYCTCDHNFPFHCPLCGGPCEKYLTADEMGSYHTLVGSALTDRGYIGAVEVQERTLAQGAQACWCGSACPACRADERNCGGRDCVCDHDFPAYCPLCKGPCQHDGTLAGGECHYIAPTGRVERFYSDNDHPLLLSPSADSGLCETCRAYRVYYPGYDREMSLYAGGPACTCKDKPLFPAYCPFCNGPCRASVYKGNHVEYHWLNVFYAVVYDAVFNPDYVYDVSDPMEQYVQVEFPYGTVVRHSTDGMPQPAGADSVYYGSASGNANLSQMSDAKRRFLAQQGNTDPGANPGTDPPTNPSGGNTSNAGSGTSSGTGSAGTTSGTAARASSGSGGTAIPRVTPKPVSLHSLVDTYGVPLAGPAQAWETLFYPAEEGAKLLTLWTSDARLFGPDGEQTLRQIEALQGTHLTVFTPREGDDPAEAFDRLIASEIIPTMLVATQENLLRYVELLEPLEGWIAEESTPNLFALLTRYVAEHADEEGKASLRLVPLDEEADARETPPEAPEARVAARLFIAVYAGASEAERAEAVRLIEFLIGEEGARLLAGVR